jgi:hypothetical protein
VTLIDCPFMSIHSEFFRSVNKIMDKNQEFQNLSMNIRSPFQNETLADSCEYDQK